MRVDRLTSLADFMDRINKSHFNLESWVDTPEREDQDNYEKKRLKILSDLERISQTPELPGTCGTTACAIGWCPAVFPDEWEWIKEVERFPFPHLEGCAFSSIITQATTFFEIDILDAQYLFLVASYPDETDPGPKGVAARIREFILNGIDPDFET
jgi:hypothetical protein